MMYRLHPSWDHENKGGDGKHDCLWRTALAYITYGDEELLDGIIECYKPIGNTETQAMKYYQVCRESTGYGAENVSRDQVIMSLVALDINGPSLIKKEFANKIRFKLSDRSFMTPDMWLWVKYIGGSKITPYIYFIVAFITLSISNTWNWVARKILGYKDRSQKGWNDYYAAYYHEKRKGYNFLQKMIHSSITPSFSYHLTSWMISTLPNHLKKPLGWLIRLGIEKSNLLLQMITGATVDYDDVMNYRPMVGTFRPQSRLDGSSTMYIKLPTAGEEKRIWDNQMDKDIIIKYYKKWLAEKV